MSGDSYHIKDQHACYFITMTVVYWVDVFSRKDYKDILVESLDHCIKNKGLNLFSWVIMSNHVHIVAQVTSDLGMSGFLRDFKKFTSKRIVEAIKEIPESRRDWLLDKFAFEALRSRRAPYYKLWRDDNHAINLTNIDMMNKINYIHNNPVKAGIVAFPDHYLYSSAIDYAGGKGMLPVILV